LPTPSIQATNLVRTIGDYVVETAEAFLPGVDTAAKIGALDMKLSTNSSSSWIGGVSSSKNSTTAEAKAFDLTLDGWDEYEAERRGEIEGHYGFIAMKFGATTLETLVADTIRPSLTDRLGFDLFDTRDLARAGIIDNLMRAYIRDASFVLSELTHDNNGAYWEAGYAEGLGKPVIYLCERAKFNAEKTHFDTNHSTTVMWEVDKPGEFALELAVTVRRSLNLFATAVDEHQA
jgi:hypothetical protein